MDIENLKKQKEEAESYIRTLQEDQLKVANGIQQILGRIQMLKEIIEAEETDTTSEEVADAEVVDVPSES